MTQEKPKNCTCNFPYTVYRNGSGHAPICLSHQEYLEKHGVIKTKPEPQKVIVVVIHDGYYYDETRVFEYSDGAFDKAKEMLRKAFSERITDDYSAYYVIRHIEQ